jgi:predicted nuclease of predicted toxin-antitoxin system
VRIKLDENIGGPCAELLRNLGHDVGTVHDQKLSGCPDERLFEICVAEARTLVTLDRDFGHVPRFPPQRSAGIVILELSGPGSRQALLERLRDFLAIAATRAVSGELWIVEPGRVRVRLRKDEE